MSIVLAMTACSTPYQEYATIATCDRPIEGAAGVQVTWLGVAGIHLDDGETGILIDPFVTRGRASISRIGRGTPILPDMPAIRRMTAELGPSPVESILVSHSHYDHAMDVPAFAYESGATVYGSETTGYIVEGHDFPGVEFEEVVLGETRNHGSFRVTFHPGKHANVILGQVPWKGALDAPLQLPAPASAYPIGQIYTLEIDHPEGRFYYMGSAALPDEAIETDPPNPKGTVSIIALVGNYDRTVLIDRVVGDLKVNAVIPMHFDNLFRRPSDPVSLMANARITEFIEVLTRRHPNTVFLPLPRGAACQILPLTRS